MSVISVHGGRSVKLFGGFKVNRFFFNRFSGALESYLLFLFTYLSFSTIQDEKYLTGDILVDG